jgi:colanic acid biosynthesis glycosyl transferase WcaI
MHIIIYSQYYPPEVGAPQTRLHELAMGLMKRGIQVTVLTAMPNYPLGYIYSGYGGWSKVEEIDGIRVIRTAIFPTQSTAKLPRLLSYFSFIFSSLLFGSWRIEQADFVLTESPPLFLGVAGLLLNRWKGARWIFNISDLWPESVVELGILSQTSFGYKISKVLERFLYKKSWLVTGQSRTILDYLHEHFPDVRTCHLPNGVDTKFFRADETVSKRERFHFIYAGLHGLAQGLDQALLALQKLPANSGINLTFVGDGPEKKHLIQMAGELKLDRAFFLESVPKKKMPEILNSADVILVPLKMQLTGAVPSKLYEAMAMGKPIILIAASEAASIVNDANCGIVVQPGDVEGLRSAMMDLKSNPEKCMQMGLNGRRAAVRKYDRADIVNQFAEFLLKESITK